MKLGLAQLSCRMGDVEGNLAALRDVALDAAGQGVEVVVAPELILSGYALRHATQDATLDPAGAELAAFAADPALPSVALGLAETGRGGRVYNSAAYLDGGELLHVHRKLYLPTYGIFEERKHFSPGQSMRAFDTAHGRVAILICNDAWQPMLPFIAVQDGAELLLIVAASAVGDAPEMLETPTFWKEITRFYARMYECFIVFVNRVGEEPGPLRFWGGSHVVDPRGTIIAQAPEHEPALVAVDVDLQDATRRRREMPLVREARIALLARELDRLAEEGGDL